MIPSDDKMPSSDKPTPVSEPKRQGRGGLRLPEDFDDAEKAPDRAATPDGGPGRARAERDGATRVGWDGAGHDPGDTPPSKRTLLGPGGKVRIRGLSLAHLDDEHDGRVSGRGPKQGRWKRWTWMAGAVLAASLVLGVLALSAIHWYFGRDLPSVRVLQNYEPPQTTTVLDRNGKLLGEIFSERRTVVSMDRIPRVMVLSMLAAEDADFYRHRGLDYTGIVRAALRSLLAGRATQGASTITQQVAKVMLLTPERTLTRKIKQLILARRIEQELSKDEILHLYLNHIYFGHGRYGVQEAAKFYFDKDIEKIGLLEASLLAGLPQAPSRLSPRKDPEAAKRRQKYVLGQLRSKRAVYWPDLPIEAIDKAEAQVDGLTFPDREEDHSPSIVAFARGKLDDAVGATSAGRGGYVVRTSIDAAMQARAQTLVQEGLQALDARHGYHAPLSRKDGERFKRREAKHMRPMGDGQPRVGKTYLAQVVGHDDAAGLIRLHSGPYRLVVRVAREQRYNPKQLKASAFAEVGTWLPVSLRALSDDLAAYRIDDVQDVPPGEADLAARERLDAKLELGPQAAAVVVDVATREVRALVGAYEPGPGFNRALFGVRQPGSSFKPIVYALGLRSRAFTPATTVLDAPAVYADWKPQNHEAWVHEGPVRLREALTKSINSVAVRVAEQVTPEQVVSFARSLGIQSPLEPSLGIALGASGVKPIEMAQAYTTFAAGGEYMPLRIIRALESADRTRVEVPGQEEAVPRQVMSAGEAFLITSMMRSVVERGTGARARSLAWPVVGKTGTSNQAKDAWFVGYSAQTCIAVWVGFDDPRPLGRKESGGSAALPIWMSLMEAAQEGKDALPFEPPPGVVTASIDPVTGLRAREGMQGAIDEYFLEGTTPVDFAPDPEVLDTTSFMMEQLGGGAGEEEQPAPDSEERPP